MISPRFPTLCLSLLCALASALPAAPVINEFLASNTTGLTDIDGSRPDWIEIHNPDPTPFNLAGYHLTDDVARPTRWTFPSPTVIPAGGYLIVFASGKNRRVPGQELHTNFNLSANGEYLGLRAPGGTTVVHEYAPTFPPQTENKSYGLLPGSIAYFNIPSPGAANNPAHAPAEAVKFSLKSRTFSGSLSLTLSTLSPTATIRYTTNQTKPTAASTLYTGPITISATTRVRAIAFEPGRPDGPVVSETYMRLSPTSPPTHQSNLPILVIHKWTVGTPVNDTVHASSFLIFEPTGAPTPVTDITTNLPTIAAPGTIERRGSSTANDPKFSMAMETQNESDDVTANDLNIAPFGMPAESDWILHAPYNFDRSLMHNDLIYKLSNQIGRWASGTRFIEVYLNTNNADIEQSDYFGVYSFQEKIKRDDDRVNVEEITTADNTVPNVQGGYIFKADRPDPGEPVLTGAFGGIGTMGGGANQLVWVTPKAASADPSELVTTAQANYLRSYIESMWTALSGPNFMNPTTGYMNWLDPAAAIDHHILCVSTKSADAFRLSAFWHKPRFGRLTAGPIWDFDRSQGSTDGRDLNPNTWRGDTGDLGTDFFHYPWYNELFKDPNFWQAWVDRLHQLRQGALSTANVHALIDQFAAQLTTVTGGSTPHSRNVARWSVSAPRAASANTPGTNGTYAGEVQWLKNWWQSRLNFMDGQFIRPATPNLPSGPVAAGATLTLSSPSTATTGVKIYYTTNGRDPRQTLTAPLPPPTNTLATLIPEISTVRGIVPNAISVGGPTGVEWRGVDTNGNGSNWDDFDHSSWYTNPPGSVNGVGYDDELSFSYLPWIGLRWSTAATPIAPNNNTNTMRNVNGSCYVRHAFTLSAADITTMNTLGTRIILSVRYDDGFVAWVNGFRVTNSDNVPNPDAVTWNTTLTTSRESTGYAEFDISSHASRFHVGENILALQGINGATTGSSDLVLGITLTLRTQATYNAPKDPGAIEYTGPLTLNSPTQLFVRTLTPFFPSDPPTTGPGGVGAVPNGTSWSAPTVLYYFPGAVPAAAGNLVISEVQYHPLPPNAAEIAAGHVNSNDFEFIRLTNVSANPIDLTGIYFSDGLDFTAAEGLQNWLPPGQSVVIVENTAAFQMRYASQFTILGQFQGELDDGGERIALNAKNGSLIAEFTYNDSDPWPAKADAGHSLIFLGGSPANPASWTASLDPGGTQVTTFAIWQSRHFETRGTPAPLRNATADPDGDALSNLIEYALGTDPLDRESLQMPEINSDLRTVSLTSRAGTLDYDLVCRHSQDLSAWTNLNAPESTTQNPGGTQTTVWRLSPIADPAAPRRFVTIQVTLH